MDDCNAPLVLGKTGRFHLQFYKILQNERRSHAYVVGTTTKGKSKLLEHCLYQDITHGRGTGLIDPHGDLADDILRYLVSREKFFQENHNADKIIYLDPTRTDYIIPFNPLVRTSGTPDYDLASEMVEIFRRVWSDSLRDAPQFTNIFMNSLLVLLSNDLTLLELQKLLTDRDYREYLLQNVKNRDIVDFYHDRFDRWGRESPHMIESTLNKVNAFTLNDQLKLILGQKRSINLRQIMDEGLVLIVNLGSCAEETAKLLGSLLTVKIQQAALSRREISLRENRRPFYLYIDEFQTFVAQEGGVKTFTRMLSEAAKFGLHLILAHQTQSQMSDLMRGAIGNIGIKVVFGVERDDAELIAKSIFLPDIDKIKEQSTGMEFTRFEPLINQWEEFTQLIDKKSLPARDAYIVSQNRPAVKIHTIDVKDRNCRQEELDMIKKYSAMKWGRPVETIRIEIEQRNQPSVNPAYMQGFLGREKEKEAG